MKRWILGCHLNEFKEMSCLIIGAGTIFRLGEQKLNKFSAGEAKVGEKQSRQSNSKCNFMQYVWIVSVVVRSLKCPQHSDEQRRAVRQHFLGHNSFTVGQVSRLFSLTFTADQIHCGIVKLCRSMLGICIIR